MLTREQVQELAADLQGTSQSLNEALHKLWSLSEDDLDQEDCEALDELVFECTVCNNWFEQNEMAENCGDAWVCEGCFTAEDV